MQNDFVKKDFIADPKRCIYLLIANVVKTIHV